MGWRAAHDESLMTEGVAAKGDADKLTCERTHEEGATGARTTWEELYGMQLRETTSSSQVQVGKG